MPEMHFQIRWPDAREERCYSPSLIIKEYVEIDHDYPLDDFMTRMREALQIASERVRAKYGFACSSARAQMERLETRAAHFSDEPEARVRVLQFIE